MPNLIISIATIIALILGPVASIIIGYKLQNRKLERDIQNNIFLNLMANRKVSPPNERQVESLNILDVIFHKNPTIVKLWHDYFESLCQPSLTPPLISLQRKKFLDLLYAIGQALNYKNLHQADIDIVYDPAGPAQERQRISDILEMLREILRNTQALVVTKKNVQ